MERLFLEFSVPIKTRICLLKTHPVFAKCRKLDNEVIEGETQESREAICKKFFFTEISYALNRAIAHYLIKGPDLRLRRSKYICFAEKTNSPDNISIMFGGQDTIDKIAYISDVHARYSLPLLPWGLPYKWEIPNADRVVEIKKFPGKVTLKIDVKQNIRVRRRMPGFENLCKVLRENKFSLKGAQMGSIQDASKAMIDKFRKKCVRMGRRRGLSLKAESIDLQDAIFYFRQGSKIKRLDVEIVATLTFEKQINPLRKGNIEVIEARIVTG